MGTRFRAFKRAAHFAENALRNRFGVRRKRAVSLDNRRFSACFVDGNKMAQAKDQKKNSSRQTTFKIKPEIIQCLLINSSFLEFYSEGSNL